MVYPFETIFSMGVSRHVRTWFQRLSAVSTWVTHMFFWGGSCACSEVVCTPFKTSAPTCWQESLQKSQSLYDDPDHPSIAATLLQLGWLNMQTGDLKQARQQLEEALRMYRSGHQNEDHPDIANAEKELGVLSEKLRNLGCDAAQAQDLWQAEQYFQESLQICRSLRGDQAHSEMALTLHELGRMFMQTRDLLRASQYLQQSLRAALSLEVDRQDFGQIADALHELGWVNAQQGDLKQAMHNLQCALRMKELRYGGCCAVAHILQLLMLIFFEVLEPAVQFLG